MITLQQILNSQSTLLEGKRVKIVRHKSKNMDYRRHVLKDRNAALRYQEKQGEDVFSKCEYIVSFFGLERSQSVMFGVFEVVGKPKFIDDHYYYDLKEVEAFKPLNKRLIIDWGKGMRAWVQIYDKPQKERKVIEILPDGYIDDFKDLLSFTLDHHQLKTLIKHPEANREWWHHLSAVKGVYLILDAETGEQYVGAAYGAEGIWQRWSTYADDPTGGNIRLKKLLEKDPHRYQSFKFSVLQTLPSNADKNTALAAEKFYKEKLGSHAHGLNAN